MLEDRGGISYIEHAGHRLACQHRAGSEPGLFFMSGFASDMTGAKAAHLAAMAEARGIGFTRFDYSGHGQSGGDFAAGDLQQWLSDALAVFDRTSGRQIAIGSSMGGWLALHLALARRTRVAGLVGIAAAPDFTKDLMWARFSEAQRQLVESAGLIELPSAYGAPQSVTKGLIRSGRELLLLGGAIAIDCPVRLIHGMLDPDVPYQTSLRLAEALVTQDVVVHLIKDGGHRLSRDSDLQLLQDVVLKLV